MPSHYSKYSKGKYRYKPEYQKFRVKTPIRGFRDLVVYKRTTQLASDIFKIKLSKPDSALKPELEILKELSKLPPKLIAEGYGDRFTDLGLGLAKLEKGMKIISNIIAKIDFLVAATASDTLKENLNNLLKKYQIQRRKILNLKKAWQKSDYARRKNV